MRPDLSAERTHKLRTVSHSYENIDTGQSIKHRSSQLRGALTGDCDAAVTLCTHHTPSPPQCQPFRDGRHRINGRGPECAGSCSLNLHPSFSVHCSVSATTKRARRRCLLSCVTTLPAGPIHSLLLILCACVSVHACTFVCMRVCVAAVSLTR